MQQAWSSLTHVKRRPSLVVLRNTWRAIPRGTPLPLNVLAHNLGIWQRHFTSNSELYLLRGRAFYPGMKSRTNWWGTIIFDGCIRHSAYMHTTVFYDYQIFCLYHWPNNRNIKHDIQHLCSDYSPFSYFLLDFVCIIILKSLLLMLIIKGILWSIHSH